MNLNHSYFEADQQPLLNATSVLPPCDCCRLSRFRAVVENFVDNWGEDILGPLAEPLLAATSSVTYKGQSDGDVGSQSGRSGGPMGEAEGLSALWPRLSRIREGMEDLEASRTKVELARQMAVDQSNPESIARALGKVCV